MPSISPGVRVRRFVVALTVLTVGPLALPGGPFDADRLLALSRDLRARAATVSRSEPAARSVSITKSPDHQITNFSLPLSFEENRGQTDARVKFLSRGQGYTLFLTRTGATLALRSDAGGAAVRMTLDGARSDARVTGEDILPGRANYFIGNDPAKWRTNVPTYGKVHYREVYRGIDLVYYGSQARLKSGATTEQLEYDFIVGPGADRNQIRLSFDGVDDARIDERGDLVLTTAAGELRQHTPVIYQEVSGKRVEIAGGYQLIDPDIEQSNRQIVKSSDRHMVAFEVGEYDRTQPLVIDPTLAYSTFLGGLGTDFGFGTAVDGSGAAYVTGLTDSADFPTTVGAFDTTHNGFFDVFVTKLSATGQAPQVYSTYLGGGSDDRGFGIAVDGSGAAYVTGRTISADFPTTGGAFDTTHNGHFDVFVTKLSATGAAPLSYSTYLGGGSFDQGHGIVVDGSGAAYVMGRTFSADFPTTVGALDTTHNGSNDVFVTKLSVTGAAPLAYSTYLGGGGLDEGGGIAIDGSGAAYVTGFTESADFPTTGDAVDTSHNGNRDVFVTKLSATGAAPLVYSTYLGGGGNDQGFGIAVDGSGAAYVTGFTGSVDFPTTSGAFDETHNSGTDAFLLKFTFPTLLTVTKTLSPTSDPGKFNLRIDGVTAGTGANVGNGGSTGPVTAIAGPHTVSETAGTSTSLADYITTIGGDCAPDGTITLADGDSKTCTITNSRKPRLTVTKTLVPAGDPGKFNLRVDGVTAGTGANVADGGTTGTITLDTLGLHTVGETAGTATSLADYITVIGGDCLSNGNTTLFAGDVKTCTITNYRKPRLTITKVLVPAGDPGKFNLQVDGVTHGTGANVGNGGTTGAANVGSLGAHTVGEAAGTGTALIDYTRVISGDCASDGSITLNAGDVKACTITNTRIVEIPGLTATPPSMFPADRRMVRVTLTPTTTDLLSLPVTCFIQSIAANTAQLGAGPDHIIYPPLAADLRAERPSGAVAREYAINVRCTDTLGAGNNRSIVVPVLNLR